MCRSPGLRVTLAFEINFATGGALLFLLLPFLGTSWCHATLMLYAFPWESTGNMGTVIVVRQSLCFPKTPTLESFGKQEADAVLWNCHLFYFRETSAHYPMLARHALLLKIISKQDLNLELKFPSLYGSFQGQTQLDHWTLDGELFLSLYNLGSHSDFWKLCADALLYTSPSPAGPGLNTRDPRLTEASSELSSRVFFIHLDVVLKYE